MTRILISLLFAGSLLGQLIVPHGARLVYPNQLITSYASICVLNQEGALDTGGFVFRVPVTSTGAGLSDVRFQLHTVTAPDELFVRVETVSDTTGSPTGNLAWADASATLAEGSVTTGFKEVALTAAGGVTRGDVLSIVVGISSFVDGNLMLGMGAQGTFNGSGAYMVCRDNGGAYSKTFAFGAWAVKIDGVWHPLDPLGAGGYAGTSQTLGSDYYGNRIVASDYTARAVGVLAYLPGVGASSGVKGALYDKNGVQVAISGEYDTDQGRTGLSLFYFEFLSPVVIQRGSQYDVVVFRSSGSGSISIYPMIANAAADLALMEYGTNIHGVNYNGATWATETSKRYTIGLVLDAIYAGSGGFMVVQ